MSVPKPRIDAAEPLIVTVPVVATFTARSSTPLSATFIGAVEIAPAEASRSVPWFTKFVPVFVVVPSSVNVPVPTFVNPPAPLALPE